MFWFNLDANFLPLGWFAMSSICNVEHLWLLVLAYKSLRSNGIHITCYTVCVRLSPIFLPTFQTFVILLPTIQLLCSRFWDRNWCYNPNLFRVLDVSGRNESFPMLGVLIGIDLNWSSIFIGFIIVIAATSTIIKPLQTESGLVGQEDACRALV